MAVKSVSAAFWRRPATDFAEYPKSVARAKTSRYVRTLECLILITRLKAHHPMVAICNICILARFYPLCAKARQSALLHPTKGRAVIELDWLANPDQPPRPPCLPHEPSRADQTPDQARGYSAIGPRSSAIVPKSRRTHRDSVYGNVESLSRTHPTSQQSSPRAYTQRHPSLHPLNARHYLNSSSCIEVGLALRANLAAADLGQHAVLTLPHVHSTPRSRSSAKNASGSGGVMMKFLIQPVRRRRQMTFFRSSDEV